MTLWKFIKSLGKVIVIVISPRLVSLKLEGMGLREMAGGGKI